MESNYHVQAADGLWRAGRSSVSPLEARGWKGTWRDELKNALREIVGASGGGFLAARYRPRRARSRESAALWRRPPAP